MREGFGNRIGGGYMDTLLVGTKIKVLNLNDITNRETEGVDFCQGSLQNFGKIVQQGT